MVTIETIRNGPYIVTGEVELIDADGNKFPVEKRMALCRCGASKNKPLCDGSHRDAGFADPGALGARAAASAHARPDASRSGTLMLKASTRGPLECAGPLTLAGTDGCTAFAEQTFLCRCGGSQRKPYCDGTHRKNGFAG